jgi:hypothetical protein
MKDEEIDMTKTKEKKDKKEDLTEDAKAKNEANMAVKYVKLGENYDEPDPEVMEANRKHIDMKEDAKEKSKKIPNTGAEAGEMEAETPEHKKKKKKGYDFDEVIASLKEDFTSQLKPLMEKIEKQDKVIEDMNAEKNAEKAEMQETLIADMSDKYMVPTNWLKEKAKKYENTEDFVQDFYEGLTFAFGTLPGNEVEAYKGDMGGSSLLTKVSGLSIDANYSKEGL